MSNENTNEVVAEVVESQVVEGQTPETATVATEERKLTREQFAEIWERNAIRANMGLETDPIGAIMRETGYALTTVRQKSSQMRNPTEEQLAKGVVAIPLTKIKVRAKGKRSGQTSKVTTESSKAAEGLAAMQARILAEIEAEKAKNAAPVDETLAEGESVPVEGELVGAES